MKSKFSCFVHFVKLIWDVISQSVEFGPPDTLHYRSCRRRGQTDADRSCTPVATDTHTNGDENDSPHGASGISGRQVATLSRQQIGFGQIMQRNSRPAVYSFVVVWDGSMTSTETRTVPPANLFDTCHLMRSQWRWERAVADPGCQRQVRQSVWK